VSERLRGQPGFALLELLIAMVLIALILAGAVQLAQAASYSFRLQRNLAALQENAHFALQMIRREVSQAGFRPAPWVPNTAIGAVSGSADGVSVRGDRLVVRRWSDRNCHENPNPVTDDAGRPRFHLRITAFEVTAAAQLSMACHYGPDAANLTRQINGLGLVEDIVALHLLFAEDSDADGSADRWVKAGHWAEEQAILGARLGVLLASPDRVSPNGPDALQVLDEYVETPGNGHLYRTFHTSERLRGRGG
jgi:prepilin-type N-terminal cleavage/methylation domain-containing protein